MLVLFILTFMSLLIIAFFDIITIEQQISTYQIRDLQAMHIADAGIETAVYELRQDSNYSGTGGDVLFPDGSGNSYNVIVVGNTMTSTGTMGSFTRTLEATYTLRGSPAPFTVVIDTWKEL